MENYVKFVNMDYDESSNQWWIYAMNNYPEDTETTRTWYPTKNDAYVYYYSIINNGL